MTSLDHGKFTRMTTMFHSLLALDVFALFFTGYAIMFNDELWWLLMLMGGTRGVTAVHRVAGLGLVALIVFWTLMTVFTGTGRSNLGEVLPNGDDIAAFIQDVEFVLGRADERHPNARQFAGYAADEVPLLSYVGKGVVWIFAVELTLLTVSGLLIWSKTGLMQFFQTKTAAMAFVVFHGLLGVIMLMGVMFHIFEHGFHPAFYPLETKAFIPRRMIPEAHAEHGEGDGETGEEGGDDESEDGAGAEDGSETGIERLTLSPSWSRVTSLMGALVVIGIVSVLVGSIFDEGYPVQSELTVGGGPANLLLTIGINVGIFVLFVGLVLSLYGNVLRRRWERQMERERERESTTATDGGDPSPAED